MLEDSYLCEANMEAARMIMDREWEKSKIIKNPYNRALYLSATLFSLNSVFVFNSIVFHTHGGC